MDFSKNKIYPLTFGILGLLSITVSTIIDFYGSKVVEVSWLASIFITISILIIRFKTIDEQKFTDLMKDTNPLETTNSPDRFLNWLTIAMIIGLMATILIHYNFILGMITYLLMQISLIIAFSGVIDLNPLRYLDTKEDLRLIPVLSVIFWIIATSGIYLVFVYNGSESLIVIPYVFFLGLMAHYTWYFLVYSDRSFGFRVMPVIASALFVFSDGLIGNNLYGEIEFSSWLYRFIDFTYVLNLFFMTQSVLFADSDIEE